MSLVKKHGELWPRNQASLRALKEQAGNPLGIYVLRDGSMPMYIGMGKIASRVRRHYNSRTRGDYWDYFSWYAIPSKKHRKEIESLLLRLLPFYLRSFNKQRGHLPGSQRCRPMPDKEGPEYVKRPHLAPKRKKHRK